MLICESWLILPMTIAYMEIVTVIIFLSARVLKYHTFTPKCDDSDYYVLCILTSIDG